MTIAIVTITYNNASGLRRTIDSIRRQTYKDIYHIIVDGESTDGTADILAEASSSGESVVITCAPAGVYNAINVGIDHALASGAEVIGLLHAGDTYSSDDVVEAVADVFAQTDADFVYGDLHYSNAAGKVVRYYGASHFEPGMLRQGYAPGHPTLYVTRRTALAAGHYDETYRVGGDFEMWLRLFEDSRLRPQYIPKDMVCMDTGGLSQRWYSRIVTNNRERMRSLRRHGLPASHLNILKHYIHVIKSYICRKQH